MNVLAKIKYILEHLEKNKKGCYFIIKLMIETKEIINAQNDAKLYLSNIKKSDLNDDEIYVFLRKAIIAKLMIDENVDDSIRHMVVYSIKKKSFNSCLSDETIKHQITKYDCHQTSLVAQTKVLLIMFIENELDIKYSDDESLCDNLKELATYTYKHLKEKQND